MQNSSSGLSVKQIYSILNRIDQTGASGYHVQKKYFDAAKQMKDRQLSSYKKGHNEKKHQTKRGNYLQDEQKLYKIVPGPGQYSVFMEWPEKSKIKVHYPEKQTYVDEVMKKQKKYKTPAPGQYEIIKSLKDLQLEKKQLGQRKIRATDRITYLDQIQHQANTLPGVGSYIVRQRVKTQFSRKQTKPQDWIKKHKQSPSKKQQKSPDMATYRPLPSDYTLFQNIVKSKSTKNFLGKVQRFKTSPTGSGLNPDKYNIIQQWRGKEKTNKTRHGIEVLSTKNLKSVYYN